MGKPPLSQPERPLTRLLTILTNFSKIDENLFKQYGKCEQKIKPRQLLVKTKIEKKSFHFHILRWTGFLSRDRFQNYIWKVLLYQYGKEIVEGRGEILSLRFPMDGFVACNVSSIHICHVFGGGVRTPPPPPPPPYKNSHHRKTDFLLVKASFLVKFRQPERSS